MGYGYCAGDGGEKDYRFIDYCSLVSPLADALAYGLAEFEEDKGQHVKQYIEDCTEDECENIYETSYPKGQEPPKVIAESEITMETPCGTYIINWERNK